jgi:hypothetical protein
MSFQRELLPPARTFYERELGGKLSRPNSKGWAMASCPFHQSKSGKSFSLNINSGGFHCFGCDAKGGDVLDFVKLRDGVDFPTAARSLGAWDEDGKPIKLRPGPPVRNLVMDFTIDGVSYRAEVRDEPTTELQQVRRFYAEACDRLSEMRDGDAEKFAGEEEAQWGILASSWELIQMEVGHGRE